MDILAVLRESSRDRSRWGILLTEMALTMAISVNAYALMSSQLDRILEPTGVAVEEVSLIKSEPFWQGLSDTRRFYQLTLDDIERIRALPGVHGVGTIGPQPLRGGGSSSTFHRADQDHTAEGVQAPRYSISPGTLQALGLQLEAGRDFTIEDLYPPAMPATEGPSSDMVIVTRAFARAMYGDDDPLDKIFMPGNHRIIGIVTHMKTPYGGGAMEERVVFFPELLRNGEDVDLVVRSAPEDRERLLATLPDVLRAAEPERILTGVALTDIQAQGLTAQRLLVKGMGLTIILLIGVSALAIYGVSSAQVTRRRRQIGMRRALGAGRRQIVQEVLCEYLGMTAAAMFVGVPLAHALNLALASSLEIAVLEPWWVCGAVVWFMVLGTLATLEPALRAARLSPAIASKAQ